MRTLEPGEKRPSLCVAQQLDKKLVFEILAIAAKVFFQGNVVDFLGIVVEHKTTKCAARHGGFPNRVEYRYGAVLEVQFREKLCATFVEGGSETLVSDLGSELPQLHEVEHVSPGRISRVAEVNLACADSVSVRIDCVL